MRFFKTFDGAMRNTRAFQEPVDGRDRYAPSLERSGNGLACGGKNKNDTGTSVRVRLG